MKTANMAVKTGFYNIMLRHEPFLTEKAHDNKQGFSISPMDAGKLKQIFIKTTSRNLWLSQKYTIQQATNCSVMSSGDELVNQVIKLT